MKKRKRTSPIVWLRRSVQGFFLLLFFYLFIQATYHPINQTGGRVTLFFELDPLVMIVTWLATYAVPAILLLSLVTLGVSLLFGRWFCGWVCPFGAFHNIFSSLRRAKTKVKLERGGYSRGQRWKYLVLLAFLGSAAVGVNVVGWLDPFSFFFRSLATIVYPAVNAGLQQFFTWAYQTDPGIGSWRLTAVSEPVYGVLRDNFLALEQPHYYWSLLIGILFVGVVALNLYRARFWCRYVCPLGALLGLVGKNPLVRLKKDESVCNDCRLCVADCQGGANPDSDSNWKPSECFFCWNCKSSCPSGAITFTLLEAETETTQSRKSTAPGQAS